MDKNTRFDVPDIIINRIFCQNSRMYQSKHKMQSHSSILVYISVMAIKLFVFSIKPYAQQDAFFWEIIYKN
jgi:hypothetical protein